MKIWSLSYILSYIMTEEDNPLYIISIEIFEKPLIIYVHIRGPLISRTFFLFMPFAFKGVINIIKASQMQVSRNEILILAKTV